MRRAVCPGSFDPVTNGHIDIVTRASALFDEVVVAVGVNKSKSRLFSAEERIDDARGGLPGLRQRHASPASPGLLTTFCEEQGIQAIVKGLRAVSDFDYELQMAQMNASLTDVETVFVPTSPEYSFLASSLVKEVAMFGGDVSGLVPGLRARAPGRPAGRATRGRRCLRAGRAFAVPPPGPLRFSLICCARTRK